MWKRNFCVQLYRQGNNILTSIIANLIGKLHALQLLGSQDHVLGRIADIDTGHVAEEVEL